eukprot:248411_1
MENIHTFNDINAQINFNFIYSHYKLLINLLYHLILLLNIIIRYIIHLYSTKCYKYDINMAKTCVQSPMDVHQCNHYQHIHQIKVHINLINNHSQPVLTSNQNQHIFDNVNAQVNLYCIDRHKKQFLNLLHYHIHLLYIIITCINGFIFIRNAYKYETSLITNDIEIIGIKSTCLMYVLRTRLRIM